MLSPETKGNKHSNRDDNNIPVKILDIDYLDICREVEERVKKDATRGCRLPLTKSSSVVNRVAKLLKSELVDILEECSKLDRMLIKRNHPESEPETDLEKSTFQTEVSQKNISHFISPDLSASEERVEVPSSGRKSTSQTRRTPQNIVDQTKSFTKSNFILEMSWSQENAKQSKSPHTRSQPSLKYNRGDTYQEISMTSEPGSKNNSSNASSDNLGASTINSSRLRVSRKGSSYLPAVTKENSAHLEDSQSTNSISSSEHLAQVNVSRKRRKTFVEKSESNINQEILRREISPQRCEDSPRRKKSQNVGPSSDVLTSNRRSVSKYKSKNSKDTGKDDSHTQSTPTKGILATPSKVTRRSSRRQGSRKRKSTNSRNEIQSEDDSEPSTSRRRRLMLQAPQTSLPFGQLVLYDGNGTPRKLIVVPINRNYFK